MKLDIIIFIQLNLVNMTWMTLSTQNDHWGCTTFSLSNFNYLNYLLFNLRGKETTIKRIFRTQDYVIMMKLIARY